MLIFVSGCTDLLLKVVDALYGVSRLRLSACQISLLSSVSFPLVVCISEWLTHGEVIMCLEAIHPVRVKVSMISVMKMVLRGELVSTPVFLAVLRSF